MPHKLRYAARLWLRRETPLYGMIYMNKRMCGLIGSVLWVIFVLIIAPDPPYIKSLAACIVGVIGTVFLAASVPSSLFSKNQKEQEPVRNDFPSSN